MPAKLAVAVREEINCRQDHADHARLKACDHAAGTPAVPPRHKSQPKLYDYPTLSNRSCGHFPFRGNRDRLVRGVAPVDHTFLRVNREMGSLETLAAALRGLSSLEQPAFDALLAASADIAAGAKGPELLRCSVLDGIEGTEALHQGLVALLLHCSKANVGSEELISALSASVQPARARAVSDMFSQGSHAMRSAVEACGFGPPHIVDVSWVRSTLLASKHQPESSGALYVITLTTRQPDGTTSPLQFTANHEQLADLVGELKSAVRQLERERAT